MGELHGMQADLPLGPAAKSQFDKVDFRPDLN